MKNVYPGFGSLFKSRPFKIFNFYKIFENFFQNDNIYKKKMIRSLNLNILY
jgi:hypothetical protein